MTLSPDGVGFWVEAGALCLGPFHFNPSPLIFPHYTLPHPTPPISRPHWGIEVLSRPLYFVTRKPRFWTQFGLYLWEIHLPSPVGGNTSALWIRKKISWEDPREFLGSGGVPFQPALKDGERWPRGRGRNEGSGQGEGIPGREHIREGSEEKGVLSFDGKKERSSYLDLGWGCGGGRVTSKAEADNGDRNQIRSCLHECFQDFDINPTTVSSQWRGFRREFG